MSTVREVVSLVRSKHRLLSSDNSINDRVVAAELNSCKDLLIKRETDKRKLWNSDSIFTTLPCLDLIEVSTTDCCEYLSDKTIARSRQKIPKLGEGNYNHILFVYTVDNSKRIPEISIDRYINLVKLRPKAKNNYFWIENGYLYITNSDIRAVKIKAYFEGNPIIETSSCDTCECKSVITNQCLNPLDTAFKCPVYLIKAVVDMASENLINTYHKLKDDQTSNEIED